MKYTLQGRPGIGPLESPSKGTYSEGTGSANRQSCVNIQYELYSDADVRFKEEQAYLCFGKNRAFCSCGSNVEKVDTTLFLEVCPRTGACK